MALFKKTLVYMFLWATFGKIGLLFIPTSVLKSNHEKTRFTKFKSVVFNAKSLINFGRLKLQDSHSLNEGHFKALHLNVRSS